MKIFTFPKYENLWRRERCLSYFWKGDSIIDQMEFYLDIALDYAIITWGLTLCGGKRSKDSLVSLSQAIEIGLSWVGWVARL